MKQLLKETEKYLQKLGAKIKEAKCTSRLFGGEVEDSDVAMTEENEILGDPRDENDQAQVQYFRVSSFFLFTTFFHLMVVCHCCSIT